MTDPGHDDEGSTDARPRPGEPEAEAEPASSGSLRRVAGGATLLTLAGMGAQVFTLVRELFVAYMEGASPALDAVLIASVAPLMVAGLIASGTSAAIVPSYLITLREKGRAHADSLLGALLSWTTLLGIVLSFVLLGAAGWLITITGPGLDEDARSLALAYTPVLMPILVLAAVASLLSATFQIHDRARSLGIAWIAGPFVSVIVTVGLWDRLGLTALAIGTTMQHLAIVVALLLLGARLGILPPFTLRSDSREFVRFLRHATPLTISASVLQFNLLISRAVGTLIAPGAVSALRYAEGIIRLPMNAILPAWSAAIYPALVRASAVGGTMVQTAADALRYVAVLFVPLAFATAALAPLIVEVAYGRGEFDANASVMTAASLAGFAPLLFFTMVNTVLTGAHNARQRGVFLMTMGFLDAGLNAFLNVTLGLAIGVAGIALATSLTMGVVQFVKAWRLGALDEGFPLGASLVTTTRAMIASGLVALPVAVVAWNLPLGLQLPAALGALVGLTAAGLVGYLVVARLIGLTEPFTVASAMLGFVGRRVPGRG